MRLTKQDIFPILAISMLLVFFQNTHAQIKDTLPAFSAVSKQGTITISWINRFSQNVSQINLQRSKDSLKGFITIHSLPNPDLRNFSYIDKSAKDDTSFYRVFILFEGANYIFSPSKRPFRDTTKPVKPTPVIALQKDSTPKAGLKKETENVAQTANTMATNNATVAVKTEPEKPPPPPPKKVWAPSPFIYTGNDGNVVISLSDAVKCNYEIRFMREDSSFLFRIPSIKEPFVKLDKVNFLQAGWVFFELYDGETLIDKNKFLITRDY